MPEIPESLRESIRQRLVRVGAWGVGILLYGTLGYRIVSGGRASWFESLYMTAITITTIGYGEILPGMDTTPMRAFTLSLIFLGVGIFTYALSAVTYVVTDPELRAYWRRRHMQSIIDEWTGHYIIAGWGPMAAQIASELQATARSAVLLTPAGQGAESRADGRMLVHLEGDPGDEENLYRAGLQRAAGLFAAAEGDALNMIVCLAARQGNERLRIVAAVQDPRNAPKMRRAGADAVVCATTIGALRMASEMVRPAVVSFLDTMLRSREPVLRIEEITVTLKGAGRSVGELLGGVEADAVLLALRRGSSWQFNPARDQRVLQGDVLVLMATPVARTRLEGHV